MWAIRRASYPIRNQSCYNLIKHTFYTEHGAPINLQNVLQYSKGCLTNESCHMTKPIFHESFGPALSLVWRRSLSSQVRNTSSDSDNDLEDGLSDLEVPPETDDMEGETVQGDGDEDDEDTFGLPRAERDGGKEPAKKIHNSQLLKLIMFTPRPSFNGALDRWVRNNPLGEGEMSHVLQSLKNRRAYAKALQFMEWAEGSKRLDYKEGDYATRLNLIAKVMGPQMAESYFNKVPKSFRGEVVYRALLTNWVGSSNVKKAEEVFNNMRDLGFPLTAFSCNQLILLYKRIDRKKISDVLKMMEKEDVKPSPFTYRLLIDAKGRVHDMSGMEDVLATMKAEGTEPDLATKALISRHYIFAGRNEKAKEMLKEIEGDDITKNRAACVHLLPLYAAFRKNDDVERIWNMCKGTPSLDECFAAIEAWGKLGKIDDAEQVFEKMTKTWKKLHPKYYNVLLRVFADHKLLSKGKELADKMLADGCKIGPLTWDVLVRLYVEAGELEKANSILQKASEQRQMKPLYHTYICVLEKYAESGDIHNAERLFHVLRRIGYVGRMMQYVLLLQAYANAKTPAYGFRERMKADNIFPNKAVLAKLNAVDAFSKLKILGLYG